MRKRKEKIKDFAFLITMIIIGFIIAIVIKEGSKNIDRQIKIENEQTQKWIEWNEHNRIENLD